MSFKELRKILGLQKHTLQVSLGTNDYWALLFISCVSLFQPKLFICVFIYLLFKINLHIVSQDKIEEPHEVEKLILYIHMNHLQSLTETIESNPQLLYCDYKKKSLLHWCKHYNNTKALMVITQMSQKYPKELLLAA